MIELQRKLLGDRVRNTAFRRALQKVIVQGKTVLVDLGSGTGYLSFLASKLGAKHCYGYEVGEVADTSRALAKRNGIKCCTFVRAHSTDIDMPPVADVLLSETLGNYALEENIIETIEDGKRFLKKGGTIIPAQIDQFVCPVTSDRLQKEIDIWDRVGDGLDFHEARVIALNNIYVKTIKKRDLLVNPDAIRRFDTIDFSKKCASRRRSNVRYEMSAPETVYGFALWWDVTLVEGVHLSTSPMASATHWEQIYLPLLAPVSLKKGQSLELLIDSDSRFEVKINLRWTVRILDARGEEMSVQALDMRKGFLS